MSDIRRYTDHEIADAHTRFRMAIKGQQVNVVEYVTAADHAADLAQLESALRQLAVARELLMEARQWKRKGYPVMKDRIDEFLGIVQEESK